MSEFDERAGVLVSPRGVPRMSRPGGRSEQTRPVTELPGFGRVGYLAASDRELAIFKTPRMSARPGPKGEPLTRVPLTELVDVELDQRVVIAILTLRFADEAEWLLQIARLHRPAAQQLVTHLRAR